MSTHDSFSALVSPDRAFSAWNANPVQQLNTNSNTKMKRTVDDASQAQDDLAARRERGRKAQQAFRQRQITAINELRAQNQAMQQAIASLASVASRMGNTELKDAVQNAREAAGMEDPEHVDDFDEDYEGPRELAHPRPTTPPALHQPIMATSGNLLGNSHGERFPSFPLGMFQEPQHYGMDKGMLTQYDELGSKSQQVGYQSGRMSPRLSYGLFLERPLFRLTSPPVDIMPFLEASTTTLSSVVFWTALVWGFKLLQATLEGNKQAAATAHKIFGEILPMKPDRTTLNGIHARLKFRNSGYVESDHPGYDPEGGIRIRSMMAQTCAANGTPLETFLRPNEAELYIKDRLGDDYRVIELGLQGSGTPKELSRVRQLVDKMIRSSVCLGDGPRWRKNRLKTTLDSWVSSSTIETKEWE